MSGRYCGFRPPMVGFCWRTCQRRRLPRAFETACIFLERGHILMKNISFARFSVGPHRKYRLVAVCWIPDSCGLVVIFDGLEPTGLCHLARLQAKVLVMPRADLGALCWSITAESDRLVAEYFRKTYRSFRSCLYSVNIIYVIMNRWAANSPTHTN